MDQQLVLTLAGPDGHHHLVLHTEDHGSHDDGRQGRLGNEGAVVHQECQTEQHQGSRVKSSQGGLDTAGTVDSCSGEGSCGWHGGHKGSKNVTNTKRNHLLARIYGLSTG